MTWVEWILWTLVATILLPLTVVAVLAIFGFGGPLRWRCRHCQTDMNDTHRRHRCPECWTSGLCGWCMDREAGICRRCSAALRGIGA